jgi:Uma2 family endonuclease
VPPLYNGDRLTQAEFHRRYEAYPEDVKFELIGGTVYMASPLRRPHGSYHPKLSGLLFLYEAATPGVEVLDNTTTILGEESEPQPDLALRILPEFGGQSRTNAKEYIVGAPELLAEVAHSSEAIDMHQKKDDYQRAGVREYIVLCLREKQMHWFSFKAEGEITPDAQGIYRSRTFPGLWIDGNALLAPNLSRLMRVVRQGLASPEHAAFVKRLRGAKKPRRPG